MTPSAPAHKTCRHLAYRMTCDQYESLLTDCGNQCQICGAPGGQKPPGTLVIDHDHDHGDWAVRGLICQGCNTTLRFDRQAPPRASAYLANPWFRREMGRLGFSPDCPIEPQPDSSCRSFDGRSWYRTAEGLWTHGFKNARKVAWWRLFYEYGPAGLTVTTPARRTP